MQGLHKFSLHVYIRERAGTKSCLIPPSQRQLRVLAYVGGARIAGIPLCMLARALDREQITLLL